MEGSYTLAAVYDQTADGVKHDSWGPGVKGQLIFTPNGQFSITIVSGERDKAASKSPRVPVGPSLAYFGTYLMNDDGKSLTYHLVASTFPAWDGIERKAIIASATATDLDLVTTVKGDATLGDFSAHLTWKRISK